MNAPAALVADVERQLSAPLHTLVAAVLDSDIDTTTRAHLDEAAHLISEAQRALSRIQTPAPPEPPPGVAPTGGPAPSIGLGGEPAPGPVAHGGAVGRPGAGFALPHPMPSVQTGIAEYRQT